MGAEFLRGHRLNPGRCRLSASIGGSNWPCAARGGILVGTSGAKRFRRKL